MGVSNWLYDNKTKERYSVQFYDYDLNGERLVDVIDSIMEIFPYDCIMYETKHGVQFISFALLKGLRITKARSVKLSKSFGDQDYWAEAKDLVLRFTSKWKVNRFTGKYISVSPKPKFKGIARYPSNYRISRQLLEFYKLYMGLPQWVYELYDNCTKYNFRIKTYHYKTRD